METLYKSLYKSIELTKVESAPHEASESVFMWERVKIQIEVNTNVL